MGAFKGPHGYDPGPVLGALSIPSLWILGAVAVLDGLKRTRGRPIATHVIPGVNHGLREPSTGRQPDFWRPLEAWLRSHNFLR